MKLRYGAVWDLIIEACKAGRLPVESTPEDGSDRLKLVHWTTCYGGEDGMGHTVYDIGVVIQIGSQFFMSENTGCQVHDPERLLFEFDEDHLYFQSWTKETKFFEVEPYEYTVTSYRLKQ